MDSIDITDSTFALKMPDVVTGETSSFDYTVYLYIGASLVILLICIYTFKHYQTKQGYQGDCEGGFCTMNHSHNDH